MYFPKHIEIVGIFLFSTLWSTYHILSFVCFPHQRIVCAKWGHFASQKYILLCHYQGITLSSRFYEQDVCEHVIRRYTFKICTMEEKGRGGHVAAERRQRIKTQSEEEAKKKNKRANYKRRGGMKNFQRLLSLTVNPMRSTFHRDGCATSEDIYWKLDALQGFVQDLNWPEEEFAKYLQVRMKALASEMISKCANW